MKRAVYIILIISIVLSFLCIPVHASTWEDSLVVTYGRKTLPLNEYNPCDGPIYFSKDGKACTYHKSGTKCTSCSNCKVFGGAKQCLGFAFYVQNSLFGGHYQNSSKLNISKYDVIKDFSDNGSNKEKSIKELFSNVRLGAHIRTKKGHSMLFLKSNNDYVWTYEANVDYHCRIRIKKRAWLEMYDYIHSKGLSYISSPKKELFNFEVAVNKSNSNITSTKDAKPTIETPNYPSLNTTNRTIADGVYVIASKLNNNYVLDIADASKDNGANLQLWKSNGTAAQTFKVTHTGNGYYQIINTNSGKALDAQNGDTVAGTNVWQYKVNNTDAQIWKIVDAGGGYYHIICKKSGLYLDLNNANVDYGENIKLWANNGSDAQKWKFAKSSSGNKESSTSSSSASSSQAISSNTSIRFELESVPKGNLKYGKSFSISGWFRSDSAIVEARAYMLDSNKNVIMEAKGSSTTSNYKIKGYALDKGMKFSKLNPGAYYLKYYVKDANGDTATWISDKFYIVK